MDFCGLAITVTNAEGETIDYADVKSTEHSVFVQPIVVMCNGPGRDPISDRTITGGAAHLIYR